MGAPAESTAPAVTRSLVIASSPRTGGQLLAKALLATGMVGDPRERLRPQDYGATRRQYRGDLTFGEFRSEILAGATGEHGVRCSILKYNGTRWVIAMERALDEQLARLSDADVLARLFPDPTWVFLRREDTARQAISWYRALSSETWRRATDGHTPPPAAVEPTWQRLAWLETMVHRLESRWRAFFDAHGITPLELTYEQVAADVHGTAEQLLAAVGLEAPAGFASYTPELAPMADAVSDDWRRRYLAVRDSIQPSPLAARSDRGGQ